MRTIVASMWLASLLAFPTWSAERAGRQELTGTVEVLVEDDFARGRHRTVHLLRGGDGVAREVRLPSSFAPRTGDRVRLRARVVGDEVVDVADVAFLGRTGASAAATAAAATERRLLVLVVDFEGSAVSCQTSSVSDLVFDGAQSVRGLYAETSFGQTLFPRDTDGNGQSDVHRVTIAGNLSSCDYADWADAADVAAVAAGVTLSLYQHRLYVLPSDVSCPWAGLANLGCYGTCRAWVATCWIPDVYAHELGHNLGFGHASTDPGNDGQIDCEYCDRSDFMGIGGVGWRQVNGPHKLQAGWLPPSAVVSPGSSAQTIVLESIETDPVESVFPQVLEVHPPGGGDPYYFSYRRPTGYDAGLNSDYASRTAIHRHAGSYQQTLLVDHLDDGDTFTDEADGVEVTQVSHDATTVTLLVGGGCAAAAPFASLTPATMTVAPGETVELELSVTSSDGGDCGSSQLTLSPSVAPGFSVEVLGGATVPLAPGASAARTIRVTAPAAAPDGTFPVSVALSGPAPEHSAQTSASLQVVGEAPDPPAQLVARARHSAVVLGWGPGVAAGYRIYRDGTPVGETQSAGWLDAGVAVGASHLYRVTALDAAGRESAGATVSITVPAGRRLKRDLSGGR